MSDPSDLIKLYSQRILALSTTIPHQDPLESPDGTGKKRSPLCGSTVTVALMLDDGRITDYGQDVKACALGQASAAISGAVILGRNRAEIATARDQLADMLKHGGPAPDAPFDGFEVLEPAKDYKNRHASILLTLDATLAALDAASTVQADATAP